MRTSPFRLLLVVVVLIVLAPLVTLAQPASQGGQAATIDTAKAQSFFKQLQTAVAIDNRLKVASMFSYPLDVTMNGGTVTVKNDAELQARYAKLFDAGMRQAIKAARTDTITPQGEVFIVDGGRVVIAPVGSKATLKVTRIGDPRS